jgi:beta-glucosidase
LKDYKKITLKKGESQNVTFKLPVSSLAYYDAKMNYVVEPGTFTIMVGKSSNNKDLLKAKILVKN